MLLLDLFSISSFRFLLIIIISRLSTFTTSPFRLSFVSLQPGGSASFGEVWGKRGWNRTKALACSEQARDLIDLERFEIGTCFTCLSRKE